MVFDDARRLHAQAWRVLRAAPLLWIAVFLVSATATASGVEGSQVLECLLAPARVLVGLIAAAAIPYLVAQAHGGRRPQVGDVTSAVRVALPRLLGFFALAALPLAALSIVAAYLLAAPPAVAPSPAAVLLIRGAAIPLLGVLASLAVAGITLDRLNGFQAAADAVLIAANHLPVVLPVALLLSVIALGLQALPIALAFGVEASLQELLHVLPGAAQDVTMWGQALLGVARLLLRLPASTYGSAIWVLLYVWATGRVDYPWIARNRAA